MTDHSQNRPLSTADMAAATNTSGERLPDRLNPVPLPPEPGPGAGTAGTQAMALLADTEARELRARWGEVQIGFVDEPRRAVEQADALVAEVMKRLAEVFSRERAELERQWSQGGDVSTEDLRVALQRYRSFFDRLLSV